MRRVLDIQDFCKNNGQGVSQRYTAVNTGEVLKAFTDAGYSVSGLYAGRTRKDENFGYQRHMIKLQHPDLQFGALQARGIKPEITIVNAYDGTTSYRVSVGLFRQVCSNGLIAGTKYEMQRVRHVGDIVPNILAAVKSISAEYPRLVETVNSMANTQLDTFKQMMFANAAAELILPDGAMNIKASDLLHVQRGADTSTDLWTVFNRIQERVIHGGMRYQTLNALGVLKNNSTRGIKAVNRNVELNQALWDLAETFIKVA